MMDNVKKGFILIFALSLSFAPLAICWYSPLNTEFNQLAIFYYIFRNSPAKEIRNVGEMVSFDSESIMKNEMPLMKVIGFVYVIVIVVFLAELLVQAIRRKNLGKIIRFTSVLLVVVTVIQFVNSVLYRQMYEVEFNKGDETEWKCMWELNLAELLIAIGICVNLYKKKHRKTKNSRQILWGHAVYSIILLIAVQSNSFYCARYGIVMERGDFLYNRTMFLKHVFFYRNIRNIQQTNEKEWLISILPLLFVLGIMIIVMMMKEAIRKSVVYVLDVVLKILTILFFCQIIYVCVFLNQTWAFIPDIPVIIFLAGEVIVF